MTRANLTEIIVVLDRSGSMASVQDATIEALNGYLRSQCRGVGDVMMTLIQFDDQYEPMFLARPIAQVPELTRRTYQPRGSTALFDAIGRTIQDSGERFARLPEPQRPGGVIFVIQTDGFENASRRYSGAQINSMISHQRDRYSWQFVFLGANQDAISSAAKFGIAAEAALSYDGNVACTHAAWGAMEKCTFDFRAAHAAGAIEETSWHFAESDRRRAKKK
jgi:hypothetical protein